MSLIKDIAKKIFPPSYNKFVYETDEIKDSIRTNREQVDLLSNAALDMQTSVAEVKNKQEQLDERLLAVTKSNEDISTLLSNMSESIGFNSTNWNAYIEKFDELKTKIEKQQCDIAELISSIKELTTKNIEIANGLSDNRTVINHVLDQTNAIRVQIPVDRVVYANVDIERKEFIDRFQDDVNHMENFKDRYLRLISGLDDDSVELITRILRRVKMASSCDDPIMNVYSLEEQEGIRSMWDHFDKLIIKIDDDLYAYHNYLMPYNNFNPSSLYYRHGMDTLKTLGRIKNRDIIDAGAFIGDSAVILSKYTKKKVYSFEADPANCELMKKTISLNHIDNVVLENYALADRLGQMDFFLSKDTDNSSLNSYLEDTEKISVTAITLDSYVEEHNLDVGVIKVDVEGAEQALIQGAMQTIMNQKPVLLISIYHNADDFFDIKPMIENLNLGYSFRLYRPPMMNVLTDTILVCECTN